MQSRIELTAVLCLSVCSQAFALDTATLDAPERVPQGAYFNISWTGPGGNADQIVIVPPESSNSTFSWAYPSFPRMGNPLRMGLDKKIVPGIYELRYIQSPGNKVLARRSVQVYRGTAGMNFDRYVTAGTMVDISWKGPGMEEDKIGIGKLGEDERYWKVFGFVSAGNPLSLKAPAYVGSYEVRYYMGHSGLIIERRPLDVVEVLPQTVSTATQPDTTVPEEEIVSNDADEPSEPGDQSQMLDIGFMKFTGMNEGSKTLDIGTMKFTGLDEGPRTLDVGTMKFTGMNEEPRTLDIGTMKFTGLDEGSRTLDIGTMKFTGLNNQ